MLFSNGICKSTSILLSSFITYPVNSIIFSHVTHFLKNTIHNVQLYVHTSSAPLSHFDSSRYFIQHVLHTFHFTLLHNNKEHTLLSPVQKTLLVSYVPSLHNVHDSVH